MASEYSNLVSHSRVHLPKTLEDVRPAEEYKKLWRHVSVGAATCIFLLEAYVNSGMPEPPVEVLIELRDRLQKLVETATGESNVSKDA